MNVRLLTFLQEETPISYTETETGLYIKHPHKTL